MWERIQAYWQRKKTEEQREKKNDSVDLNTNSFTEINERFIHYLPLRVFAQMWKGEVWQVDGDF